MSTLANKNQISKDGDIMEATETRSRYEYGLKVNKKIQRAIHNKKKRMTQDERKLINEIDEAYREMTTTFSHFESATSPDLIEYYTYKYKADQIKYGYLIRCMKQLRSSNESPPSRSKGANAM